MRTEEGWRPAGANRYYREPVVPSEIGKGSFSRGDPQDLGE